MSQVDIERLRKTAKVARAEAESLGRHAEVEEAANAEAAADQLEALTALRKGLQGEVERLRKQATDAEVEAAAPGGCEGDTYTAHTAWEAADRLAALLDSSGKT